jgi:hypothetical protein
LGIVSVFLVVPSTLQKEAALLTEQEVSRSWSLVFKGSQFAPDSFDRAEQLLEELRPESPLRLRLTHELEELRKIHIKRATVSA